MTGPTYGYAVLKNGTGWRSVNGPEDVTEFEYWIAFLDGPPPDPVPLPPTPEEILASQSAILVSLKLEAEAQKTALTNRISTIQDAIDYIGVEGMEEFAATEAEIAELPKRKAQLPKWKNYAILLGRVTTQAGWPPNPVWPAKPTEGMDLSVSAALSEEVM